MKQVLLVGLGGCLGAMARYKLGGAVLHYTTHWRLPLSTLLVNIVGCVAAGFIAGCIERREWFSPDARLFLMTGILGGFTTFSAFGIDTVFLFRRGDSAVALLYVAMSVVCALAALRLGIALVPQRPV
jgi:CrcB protein